MVPTTLEDNVGTEEEEASEVSSLIKSKDQVLAVPPKNGVVAGAGPEVHKLHEPANLVCRNYLLLSHPKENIL